MHSMAYTFPITGAAVVAGGVGGFGPVAALQNQHPDCWRAWLLQAVRQDQTELMETIVVDSDELAWSTDRDSLFGNVEPLNHNTLPAFRGGKEMLLNVSQDEHFMVWMRPAAHSGANLSFLSLLSWS